VSVTMFQRKMDKFGKTLGATTGWIHRREVVGAGVRQVGGVTYDYISPTGTLTVTRDSGRKEEFAFDTIVMCHGQVPNDRMAAKIQELGLAVHRIGGAREAAELDAKRAIREGHELAMSL
jgi:2,4-dienoyl-CoA reductase (NADPH2)